MKYIPELFFASCGISFLAVGIVMLLGEADCPKGQTMQPVQYVTTYIDNRPTFTPLYGCR